MSSQDSQVSDRHHIQLSVHNLSHLQCWRNLPTQTWYCLPGAIWWYSTIILQILFITSFEEILRHPLYFVCFLSKIKAYGGRSHWLPNFLFIQCSQIHNSVAGKFKLVCYWIIQSLTYSQWVHNHSSACKEQVEMYLFAWFFFSLNNGDLKYFKCLSPYFPNILYLFFFLITF